MDEYVDDAGWFARAYYDARLDLDPRSVSALRYASRVVIEAAA